ncbi:TPA: hypothetical protein RUZ56_003483 [Vibrio cholerae]|uniref:hypothetical protein n=1 Tax=Vibrio cholerae TaxID=666 RepID=UPI000A875CCE|nr:hypothetical protein [Vibrio cholerae]HDZ9313003.1 hypothetical protein [Vibrio cholerae]HDZ9342125.1 hypothetical protein [Vibrio cholerae]
MGDIVRVSCSCGFNTNVAIGCGFNDTLNYLRTKEKEYRYWVLNIDTNELECLTTNSLINISPEVISENKLQQALDNKYKIECVSCQANYFTVEIFGHWD